MIPNGCGAPQLSAVFDAQEVSEQGSMTRSGPATDVTLPKESVSWVARELLAGVALRHPALRLPAWHLACISSKAAAGAAPPDRRPPHQSPRHFVRSALEGCSAQPHTGAARESLPRPSHAVLGAHSEKANTPSLKGQASNKGMHLTRSAPATRTAALAGDPQCSTDAGSIIVERT